MRLEKTMNYKIIISFLLFFSCYRLDLDKISIPEIEDIPDPLSNFENDYSINDFWAASKDSSLLSLLNEFNLNSSQISILNTQAKMSKIQHRISRSDRFPSLSINNSRSKKQQNLSAYGLPDSFLDVIEESGDSEGIPETFSIELATQWEIDLWGRLKSKDISQYYSMKAHLNDISYAKESLRANFIKLFFVAINLKNQIIILEKNLKNLKLIKELTEKRYLNGMSNPDEIHLASANYHLYQTKLLSVQSKYNDIIRNIELMMNKYPGNKTPINYNYPDSLPLINENIPSRLLERRPDVVSIKEKIISSNVMLSSNKKNLLPNISLTGSIGQSSSDLKRILDKDFSVWGIGVSVFQPVLQGGRLKSIIKLNKHEIEALEQEYIYTVYNAFYEAEKHIDLDTYLLDTHNEILISKNEMSQAVDFAIKSYELGLVDLVYLLNYQQQYFEISLEENNILSDRYLNRIDLILALGGKLEYQ